MTHYDGLIAFCQKMGYFGYFAKKWVKMTKNDQKWVNLVFFRGFIFQKNGKFMKPCFFLILSRHGFLSKPVQKSAKKWSKTPKMGHFGPFLATFGPTIVWTLFGDT